jgi:TrmH family RNA methyltransferase
MGTLFSVPVTSTANLDDLFDWAHDWQLHVVGTSAHAETILWETSFEVPTLLLFGNEGTGLDPEVMSRVEKGVRIPMSGTVSSLNLAVAVGIFLYEVRRQQSLR